MRVSCCRGPLIAKSRGKFVVDDACLSRIGIRASGVRLFRGGSMCQDALQDRLDLRRWRPPGNEGELRRGKRVASGAPQATRGDAVPGSGVPQATRGGTVGRPIQDCRACLQWHCGLCAALPRDCRRTPPETAAPSGMDRHRLCLCSWPLCVASPGDLVRSSRGAPV